MKRTEDDLRAAFTLAAEQAPDTSDVLARLAAAERAPVAPRRHPRARVWLPIAAAAVVVAAIAVPLAISGSHSNNQATSASAAIADSAGGAKAASSAAAGSEGFAVPPSPAGSVVPNVAAPVCTPADVRLSITWTTGQTGQTGLTGAIKAQNISQSSCDLAVKPAVYPLDSSGQRLAVQNVSTAEGYVGPSNLLPGATASATLSWASWCGAKAGNQAEVEWGTGTATAVVSGAPTAPGCVNGKSGAISSGWFGPLS